MSSEEPAPGRQNQILYYSQIHPASLENLAVNLCTLHIEITSHAHVQAVEVAIRLLQMTAAAGHFLQENRLYKSFRLLQRVRESLPTSSSTDDAKIG